MRNRTRPAGVASGFKSPSGVLSGAASRTFSPASRPTRANRSPSSREQPARTTAPTTRIVRIPLTLEHPPGHVLESGALALHQDADAEDPSGSPDAADGRCQ